MQIPQKPSKGKTVLRTVGCKYTAFFRRYMALTYQGATHSASLDWRPDSASRSRIRQLSVPDNERASNNHIPNAFGRDLAVFIRRTVAHCRRIEDRDIGVRSLLEPSLLLHCGYSRF